jgi:flagellar M-ring protein FliF
MANEPALARNNMPSLGAVDDETGVEGKPASALLEGFYNLNILRQLGLMVGLAASIAIGFAVVLWAQEGDYRPLYSNIHNVDGAKVIAVLDASQIDYKIEQRTGALLVSSEHIHDARLMLADAGMPGDKSAGFELLDKEQPLGTSQFMETTRYRRGLEGELARTIKNINVVRNARVHLATPKTTTFIRDKRKPTASVFVELFPGATLKTGQVKAIANLVASSISELSLEDVTVVDQKGNLLSSFEDSDELNLADKQLHYVRKIEEDLSQRIHDLLRPVVGAGRYKAQVSADIDFTKVEQTDEMFNPDLPSIRSEQVLEEQRSTGREASGVPGALSNQPPVAGEAPEVVEAGEGGETINTQGSNLRKQATRNFELDRTISYTKHQVGQIKRITVAVVVDDMLVPAEGEGVASKKPWGDKELDRLSILVRDAIGFNAARGDSINVINAPFVMSELEDLDFPEPEIWEQPWVWQIARIAGSGLLLLVLFFGVLRPVLKNLSSSGQELRDVEMQKALAEAGGPSGEDMGDGTVTLSGGENMLLPSPNESYEQQLNAIKGLIAEDPGRVAQVVKRWVASGE